jgi:hypothetical protein
MIDTTVVEYIKIWHSDVLLLFLAKNCFLHEQYHKLKSFAITEYQIQK